MGKHKQQSYGLFNYFRVNQFVSIFFSIQEKMILALSLCSVLAGVLIPVMQGDSAMDRFSNKLAYEKPTANGGGESGAAKDVSSEAEARKVSLLKELGRLHHNKAVAFLSKRQDFPGRDKRIPVEHEREEGYDNPNDPFEREYEREHYPDEGFVEGPPGFLKSF